MQVASKKNLAMTHDQMKAAYERRLTDLRKESIARRQEAGKKYLEAKERGDKTAEEHYLKQYRYLQEQRSEKLLQQRAAYSVLSEYKSADRAQRIQREQLLKYRSRVESGAKQLSKWLQTPTEQNHIPEVMRNTVYDFLDSLDFSGKSDVKMKFWKDNLQAVKDYMARADAATVAGETEAYVDIDPDFADKVQKIMEYARGNMSIMDMDTEHLKLLSNIIDTLKTACRNVNTIIVNGRRQAIENFAVKAIKKAESIEMGENNRFTNSVAGELLTAGNIKSAWEKFDAMTGAIGNITGVPYKNVSRDIQAIIRTASEILNNDQSVDPYGLIAAAYEGMQIEYTVKSNTEDAYQAMLKGYNAKAERAAATIESFYKDQVAKELAKGKTQEEAEKDARTAVNKNVASVLGDYYMDAETAEERAKIRELAASITIGDVPAWISKAPGAAAQALYDAYESKDQTALQDALNEISSLYDDHVVVYMKSGMSREEAEKKAKSDLKSNVTGILKPYYQEAGSESEKVNIQQLALRITVAHQQLYNGYNFKSNWK